MSTFRPFKGLRPRRELAEQIASPPYDVINSEEAREMAAGNPLSFLHVVKPEIDLDPSIDLYDDRVYAKAAENFDRLIDEGHMVQDGEPSYYVYAQEMGGHRQVGIVGCASADDYFNDVIRKHEFTRPDKEKDRTRHVDTLDANAGPVFLTYRASEVVDALVAEITATDPTNDFTADGVRHILWPVAEPAWVEKVEQAFAGIQVLYVADGHHRSASAASVRNWRQEKNPGHTGDEEYNFFLAVVFPHDQMQIMAYNRVVEDLNGMSPAEFLARAGEKFEVSEAASPVPASPQQFCVYLEGKWHLLSARAGSFPVDDPVLRLDCSILQKNLLEPLLGIGDPRTDKRINFVGGIRGTEELEKLVDSGKYTVAFSLHPTSIVDLMSVADAGQVMPPKSTWFEPKLRSGLVVHKLS